jgi:membrane associated rhomboid family serine protease
MGEEKKKALNSIKITGLFLLIIWTVKLVETIFGISFVGFGLLPREAEGLFGIFTFPLLHGSWDHLMSNTLPAMFLLSGLFYFYPESSKKVFAILYIVPGILLWMFGRQFYHIGASGLIYALAAFIFFSGIIKRDKRSIVLALLVTFFYGGLVWGVLPIKSGVSWEGHLFGGITGLAAALIFKKYDKYKKYDWEDEDDDKDYNVRDLEVSYKKGYPLE